MNKVNKAEYEKKEWEIKKAEFHEKHKVASYDCLHHWSI